MKKKREKGSAVNKIKIILVLLVLVIAAGLFIFNHARRLISPPPAFEEEHVISSRLKQTIDKVDHVIYESVYSLGIKKEAISFSKVVPRHETNLDWDFTELSVIIDNPDFINRLETIITKKIVMLGHDVILKTEKSSGDLAVLSITVFNLPTHRLKLHLRTANTTKKIAKLPRVAFIIDDIGYDSAIADAFMGLKIPVCLSVLPDTPYSKEIAQNIVKRKKEMLLHLPMEPKGYPGINPGQDALMLNMDRETIQKIVREDIKKLPGLKGVNHHMGSLFSEDYIRMKYVLDEIKKHDLYYIDSRTTNLTVAFKVAKALGIPAAEKSLFIDNDLNEKTLVYQMERLLGIARNRGEAIGIGHPHLETLNILKKYTEQLMKEFEVVPVSELVR
jgi:polysaccharide deacetylase 2 family uncharacterized protein YibQ